jgi:hypothetical protein
VSGREDECMWTVDVRSMNAAGARRTCRALLAGATLAFVATLRASAAEPPVSVEYHSAFADYRRFDPQAPSVKWRQANDAIRDGTEGAAHGMHDMRSPMEAPPAAEDEPRQATPNEHQAHHQ